MQRRLLAALVIGAGRARSADALINALWGESPPASASKLLQVYVSQLRKALPTPAHIRTDGGSYALELDEKSLDAARFERLLEDGQEALGDDNPALAFSLFERALDLWRGPAYADIAYEDFARAESERLEELREIAIEERIEAGLALGRHEELLAEVSSLATAHPLRERLQAQAMVALSRCGRQSEALELFASLRRRLQDELGLEPARELRDLQRRILKHDPSLGAPSKEERALVVLPAPPTALLGRERELREVCALIAHEDVRLVVLTGAGGSGKTRLAIEAARAMASSFANGAVFVNLGPLRDPELVVGEIARALGVRQAPKQELLETLAAALCSRELLLVVDNAEHLRGAAPMFVELVARAPRLTLVVTSRVVLHLSGEHVYPVEPLDEDAAAALFFERAGDADPRFSPDEVDDVAIRQICRRLDGLPLAIELAASRIRTLTPAELLRRLDSRLPLLTGGPRDLPARQQTLRATLDWTSDLLNEPEMKDLMRLVVFAGGFTLEAAEAVCGTTVERISSLIDHNLLRRTATVNRSRYSMLETIREYAVERLEAARGLEAARAAHAAFYMALADQLAGELDRGQAIALDQLETELDNFRAAFAWATETDTELALRLAAALKMSWLWRNQLAEGRDWLAAVLERPHAPSSQLAAVAAELGRIQYFLEEREDAAARIDQALALGKALGLPDVTAQALNTQHLLLTSAGQHEEALAVLERAVTIAREHNLGGTLLRALYNLSYQLTTRDRQVEAKRNDLEGLRLAREGGDQLFESNFLFNLVWGEVLLGNWDAALRVVEESEKRPLPRPYVLLSSLPWLLVQRGELGEARRTLEKLAPLATQKGFQGPSIFSLAGAVVLRAEGRFGEALATAGEVLARRDALGGRHGYVKFGFIEAAEAAFALDDLDRVAEMLRAWDLSPSDRTPFVEAHCEQFAARLAVRRGKADGVEAGLVRAAELFDGLSRPFYFAVAVLERAEWLVHQSRDDDAEPLLADAQEIFRRLKAAPWLQRASHARTSLQVETMT